MNVYDEMKNKYSKNYVLSNPNSFVSPYILYRNSYNYEMEELEKALASFDTTLSHSIYTGFMQHYLATLKRTAVGQPYLTFFLPDTSGNNVFVKEMVGKSYLLIDFWASWCAPCREENPNLVALYSEFHGRGFDIIGVSMDSRRDRWVEAIRKDNLTWAHVSDLKGWESAVGKLYGIRSIPANVMIDTAGYIVAKNLRGEDLRNKLEELFPAAKK
jgi:peroxiredoxin